MHVHVLYLQRPKLTQKLDILNSVNLLSYIHVQCSVHCSSLSPVWWDMLHLLSIYLWQILCTDIVQDDIYMLHNLTRLGEDWAGDESVHILMLITLIACDYLELLTYIFRYRHNNFVCWNSSVCEDVIVKGENALQTSVTFQLKQAHSNLFKVWNERERERVSERERERSSVWLFYWIPINNQGTCIYVVIIGDLACLVLYIFLSIHPVVRLSIFSLLLLNNTVTCRKNINTYVV